MKNESKKANAKLTSVLAAVLIIVVAISFDRRSAAVIK